MKPQAPQPIRVLVALSLLLLGLSAPEALAHRALRVGDLNVTLEMSLAQEGEGDRDHLDEGPVPGRYEIRLYVQDIARDYAPVVDARIEVLLLRGDRPEGNVVLQHEGSGKYVGRVELPEPGDWTLQAEIARAGREPVTAEFALEVVPGSHGDGGFSWVGWLLLGLAGLAALGILGQVLARRGRAPRTSHP